MPKQFKGKTEDAAAPFLGAEFWKEGTEIRGTVLRGFDTENGRAYVIGLDKPVNLGGEEVDEVAIGALRGFLMALQAAHLEALLPHDHVIVLCTGTSPTQKGSPRLNFAVQVDRP